MIERDITKQLLDTYYNDMEGGDDIESIDYRSLIHIITELHSRIEKLEQELEYQKDYAMEQNERYG